MEYRNFYTHRKLEEETYGFNNWWSRISTITHYSVYLHPTTALGLIIIMSINLFDDAEVLTSEIHDPYARTTGA